MSDPLEATGSLMSKPFHSSGSRQCVDLGDFIACGVLPLKEAIYFVLKTDLHND